MNNDLLDSSACGAPNPLLQLANRTAAFQYSSTAQGTLQSYEQQTSTSSSGTFHMRELMQQLPVPWERQLHRQLASQAPNAHTNSIASGRHLVHEFLQHHSPYTVKSVNPSQQPFMAPSAVPFYAPPSWMNCMPTMNPLKQLYQSMAVPPTLQSQPQQFLSEMNGTSQNTLQQHVPTDREVLSEEAEAARRLIASVADDQDLQNSAFMTLVHHIANGSESQLDPSTSMDATVTIQPDVTSEPTVEQRPNLDHISEEALFAMGEKLFSDGLISDAIVAFEEVIQRKPLHAASWRALAVAYAENEQDTEATKAAEKAVSLEPQEAAVVWLSLARVHTNEQRTRDAVEALHQWLDLQRDYRHLPRQLPTVDLGDQRTEFNWVSKEEIEDLERRLLQASQVSVQQGIVDGQLQSAMGIFYHLKGDFDKAADCFTTALQVQPESALLWNKLGATLANGERDEQAVFAYRRAIELAPGYVRARSNLSISCLMLEACREALEHASIALELQSRSQSSQQANSSLWQCARVAARRLGDPTLMQMTVAHDLRGLMRALNIHETSATVTNGDELLHDQQHD